MSVKKNQTENYNTIDPIYEEFAGTILSTLESTEFYEYFMDTVARGKNTFQFSNRKMEKLIDLSWVDAIDDCLEGFQNIIMNPRNVVHEEEIIVNVANAKKAGPDVVRHLAQHGSMVENFNEETGEVRPSKLMQKVREDSTELYENRLVFTVLEHAFNFVRVRHSALMDAMSEEYGAKLKVNSDLETMREDIHVDMFIHIREKDSVLETDEKNREVFDRISRIYRVLGTFMNTQFAEQMSKMNRIKGNIVKTNVLKKNPDYKKIVKLWEFLRKYDDVGYMIKVTEQNPHIDEQFQQDIYNNIMFQYIVLKSYLENEEDRQLAKPLKTRKRKLKPKMIHQIIEEMTENYDLPDIEIRKVLIEELTKEQLMLEEEAERLRLVEEQEARRKAEEEERRRLEEERLKAEAEEQARVKAEAEAREKEAQMKLLEEQLEDRRRTNLFLQEIALLQKHRIANQNLREEEAERIAGLFDPRQDFAEEAARVEAEEARKEEEKERAIRRRIEEEERRARAIREEEERRRREEEEEKERIRKAEEEAQIAKDMEVLYLYLDEVRLFAQQLEERKAARKEYEDFLKAESTKLEAERNQRRERMEQQGQKKEKGSQKWRFGG